MSLMKFTFFTLIALGASLFAGFEFGKNVFYAVLLSFCLFIAIIDHISVFISELSNKSSIISYDSREIKNTIIDIKYEIKELRNDLNEKVIEVSLDDAVTTSELKKIREKLDGISGTVLGISGTVEKISYSVS